MKKLIGSVLLSAGIGLMVGGVAIMCCKGGLK